MVAKRPIHIFIKVNKENFKHCTWYRCIPFDVGYNIFYNFLKIHLPINIRYISPYLAMTITVCSTHLSWKATS